ncbi:MAG: ATP-dependent zinc metalloprotease FtsH, partial [Actinomycetota bacterium]
SPSSADGPGGPAPRQPKWRRWLLPVSVLLMVWLLFGNALMGANVTEVDYSTFLERVEAGEVERVTIDPDGRVDGAFSDGENFRTQVPTALDTAGLTEQLENADVAVEATAPQSSLWQGLLSLLPLLLIFGLFLYLGRRARGQLGGALGSLGRAKTKVVDAERPSTRFADVAGYDGVKREVGEIIDYLKDPMRYQRAGAMGPRGVLMVGPPGTGKTYLARAVAGEADVPFLPVTGSSFVEMFVGVGASRVRDLFEEARKRSPAIIFIDEIDAIGGRRTSGGGAISNDEREQTLNQLLAEMDGFDPTDGVVVLAATNRPETLDPALLRPGRFDRQVIVPLPTQAERRAILAVHSRGKRLAADVDLDVVARGTPGFSAADLANLANEAALHSVRAGRDEVTATDFEAARDRIVLGRSESSNVLLPDEKRAVAVHESGHALVAALRPQADPVHKVTILPAGMALGATHQFPVDERHLHSEAYLYDALSVRLGGRAAELVIFGEGSTGAANDLVTATALATKMVRDYGMSPEIGPVGYGSGAPMYLGGQEMRSREHSEVTQHLVDREVSRLLREAEQRAVSLLRSHRHELDRLTELLLEHETVDGQAVYALVGRGFPGAPEPAGAAAMNGGAS